MHYIILKFTSGPISWRNKSNPRWTRGGDIWTGQDIQGHNFQRHHEGVLNDYFLAKKFRAAWRKKVPEFVAEIRSMIWSENSKEKSLINPYSLIWTQNWKRMDMRCIIHKKKWIWENNCDKNIINMHEAKSIHYHPSMSPTKQYRKRGFYGDNLHTETSLLWKQSIDLWMDTPKGKKENKRRTSLRGSK